MTEPSGVQTATPKTAFTPRIRKSPFFAATERYGCKAYTSYNRTLLPLYYESPVADFWRLVEHVTLWDVACERQVEITGPDAARFTQLLVPRNLDACAIGQCKYVPLTEDGWLWASFGGQFRFRYEKWRDFGFVRTNDDGFELFRTLLHADLHVGENVRFFVQGKSAFATERNLPGGQRGLDVDELDLQNAFADVSIPFAGGTFTFRPGRQELLFGKQRLVSPLDWSNTGVPTMSVGSRSGVNWMRRKSVWIAWASVRTMSVFARPGSPSRRMWPPVKSATRRPSTASFCPTTRLCTASLTLVRSVEPAVTVACSIDGSSRLVQVF